MITFTIDEALISEKMRELRSLSFSTSLSVMRASAELMRKEGRRMAAFVLDSKILGYEFARGLGLATPQVHRLNVPLEEIDFRPGTVVKPVNENSARGVFIVKHSGEILYLNSGNLYAGAGEARRAARTLLNRKQIKADNWLSEDLVSCGAGIARDLKFYMFYGEIGLVLESRRLPGLKRCWYDGEGRIVKTGKYDDNLFEGHGDYGAVADLARRVSLALPGPFARLDFLVSDSGILFGEVTPIPGGHDRFNHQWDSRLGTLFAEASVRLSCDVASGKRFETYEQMEKREPVLAARINTSLPA